MLGWSQDDLASGAKVAKATIATFEAGKRKPYDRTLDDLQAAFEHAGVTFDLDAGRGDGVRFRASTADEPT